MKRKDPPEAASASDNKRARPSTPVDDELEDEGMAPFELNQTSNFDFRSVKKSASLLVILWQNEIEI